MSEFQYYEFYSIDKPLSDIDKEEIGSWSSRTIPSTRKAIFTYSYGDFPKDVDSVLLKYFDAFFYIANWGTKRLMFKFPKEQVDFDVIKQYQIEILTDYENGMKVYEIMNSVIVDICFSEEEGFGWLEEEQFWLDEFVPLRNDVIRGDYRSLFLIWIHTLKMKYEIEELKSNFKISQELIPNNLKNLNNGLETLLEFFDIDKKLVDTMSNYSLSKKKNLNAIKSKISSLPESVKNDFLLKLLEEDIELANQLYYEIRKDDGTSDKIEKTKRTEILLSNILNQ